MTHTIRAAALAILTLFTACSDVSDTDPETSLGPLVIEGWVSQFDGGEIEVAFSRSLRPNESGGSLADAVIRWGRVYVIDQAIADTIYLTGSYQPKRVPPFIYRSWNLQVQPGHDYTVVAEWHGLTARSTCRMPEPTPVEELVFEPLADNDNLMAATLRFRAPADCPAYYHVSTRQIGLDNNFYPGMLGTVCATVPGALVEMPVCRGKHITDTLDFIPHWRRGQRMEVRFERVTREVYDFWTAFNDAVLFGASQFVGASMSLPTNVEGGYGVWSAQGVTLVAADVPE